jgi:hypothetical protein
MSGCSALMMFGNGARNKSSVSERSGFLGFMVPPAQGRKRKESYSLKAQGGESRIANCKLFDLDA